jgi:hypothetical protein
MAEKMNPTATDADRMKAASDGAKMADTGVKAGLVVAGIEGSALVVTATAASTTVLVASQTVGAAAETYVPGGVATLSEARSFVGGLTNSNPRNVPLTPGGMLGAAVRLTYTEFIKPLL